MNFEELGDWCLTQVVSALATQEARDEGVLPSPTKRRVHFGGIEEVARDQCCGKAKEGHQPGQVVAAIGRSYPSAAGFPAAVAGPHRPSHPSSWAVPVIIEIARCTPTLSDKGTIDWEAFEADNEVRLREALRVVCHFQAVMGRGIDNPEGYIVAMSADEDSGCKAVRIELMLHLA